LSDCTIITNSALAITGALVTVIGVLWKKISRLESERDELGKRLDDVVDRTLDTHDQIYSDLTRRRDDDEN